MVIIDEVLLEERLRNFHPEPLITPVQSKDPIEIPMVKEDKNNIDLAKTNYLNFLNNEELKTAAEATIREYGVGTCGPRAFYGTTDVHLELEERLAEFLHVEECIVYSYGFVAISSAVAAYCKRNDTIFVDEKANFAIEQGWIAARSKIVKFAHNNPADFREKLQEFERNEKKKSRKFLIIEGISWKTGKLCPLPEFIQVAEEFKLRVFLEESYTLGVFGATGRGLLEHFNLETDKVDMIFGTLEGAIGSIGGFCAGSSSVIEHQRLSGSGYIFSASLPTYLVKVAIKALGLLGDKPKKFQHFTETFHLFLEECGFDVISHPLAPFKVIKGEKLKKVQEFCKNRGVHFIFKDEMLFINLNVKLVEEKENYDRICKVLKESVEIMT